MAESDTRRKQGFNAGLVQAPQHVKLAEISSEEYLAKNEEDLNKRVTLAVTALGESYSALIDLAAIGSKNSFNATDEAFQIDIRVQTMIKAAENLLSLNHTLKMLHLLNARDQSAAVQAGLHSASSAESSASRASIQTALEGLLGEMNGGVHPAA